jgi:hypothetical protein
VIAGSAAEAGAANAALSSSASAPTAQLLRMPSVIGRYSLGQVCTAPPVDPPDKPGVVIQLYGSKHELGGFTMGTLPTLCSLSGATPESVGHNRDRQT